MSVLDGFILGWCAAPIFHALAEFFAGFIVAWRTDRKEKP